MLDDRFYVSNGPLTLQDIIEGLEVTLLDPKFRDEHITHPARLVDAAPGSVTFLGSKKSLDELASCKATACFVTEKFSADVGARHIIPIVSKTPRVHFARAMTRLGKQKTLETAKGSTLIAATAKIHKSAVIGAGALIGANVVIGPNSVIGPGVEIGAGSRIAPNVSIETALIGENCIVKAGAVIGGRGFGVGADELGVIDIPHFGRVVLGNGVSIGANSCVDRGQIGDTVLGDNVKLDNLVQIGHNVHIGDGSCLAAHSGISGSCIIGRGVMMGGRVGLADHINIGDNVRIAANAGVMNDIPVGEFWGGIPAQPMRAFMREVAMNRKLARKSKKPSNET